MSSLRRTAGVDAAGLPLALVLDEVKRIQNHPLFASSHQLKRFLEYTVGMALEGRGKEIKEYTIAVEVFGRSQNFDPSNASIVRTQAGKLRKRIRDYYAGLPEAPPVLIVYRPGSYCPTFEYPGNVAVCRQAEPSDTATLVVLRFTSDAAQPQISERLRGEVAEWMLRQKQNVIALSVVDQRVGDRRPDLPSLHESFGDSTIIEGSISDADGGVLKLSAMQVPTGLLLWTESIPLPSAEVSGSLLSERFLGRHFSGSVPTAIKRTMASVERFTAPLARVRNNCDPSEVVQAIQSCEWLTLTDPEDALGWAGLAITMSLRVWLGYSVAAEYALRAKAAALQAINLASAEPECIASMGMVRLIFDRDEESACSLFKSALTRDPLQPEATIFMGIACHSVPEYMERAGRLVARAIKSHPEELLSLYADGCLKIRQKRPEAARRSFADVYSQNPRSTPALISLILCNLALHDYEAAEKVMNEGDLHGRFRNELEAIRIFTLGRLGRVERARELYAELSSSQLDWAGLQPWARGAALIGVGKAEEAKHQFAKSYLQPWPMAIMPALRALFPEISNMASRQEKLQLPSVSA